MLIYHKQQSYFSQIVPKKAEISISFFRKILKITILFKRKNNKLVDRSGEQKIKHDKFKFSSVSGQLSRTWFTNSEFLRKEMAETFLIG